MSSPFKVIITAKSEEELERMLNDKLNDGYKLVKKFEKISNGNSWGCNKYDAKGRPILTPDGGSTHHSYRALVERDNREYLERKERERKQKELDRVN